MTLWDAILLGIIQGITEFLPISSDGHLAVSQYFLGLREPMLAFDVLLHIGSLVAIIAFYRRRVAELALSVVAPSRVPGGRKLILLVVIASLPTAIVGLGFEEFVEELFTSPVAAAMFWLLTAGLLFGVSRMSLTGKTVAEMTVGDALLIGLFQGLAILPGLSRSGTTLAMGVMCGLHPKQAADFSFLIAMPAILGAVILKSDELLGLAGPEQTVMLAGAVTSAIVSYAAIWFLLKLLQRRIIQPFAWYLVGAALLVLVLYAAGY